MGRDATKAAGNPWYQARKKAAEYDDRLCSRESAAEQLGMSVSSLADAELGNTKFMPVDKAVLMADRYQFFPTPRAVAERMCEMAEIDSTSEVLEPSCGNGQLADVIWEHLPAGMCCIELNTDMKRYLAEKPYGVNYRDFLDVTKKEIGSINRVVMNPPFTRHQDIDHVRHAYDLLDAGGVLVAIMCESTFFRSDKKSVEFRDFLNSVYAQTIKLEPGAFRESGTDVVTRIVKIRKPL